MTSVDEWRRLSRAVPDWHERGAACRQHPGIDWIDASPNSKQETAARLICSTCPLRFTCARDALERGEPHGVWGGLNRVDRRDIAREYGYPSPSNLPEHGTNSRYAKHGCRCPDCAKAHAVYEWDRRRARQSASQRATESPQSA